MFEFFDNLVKQVLKTVFFIVIDFKIFNKLFCNKLVGFIEKHLDYCYSSHFYNEQIVDIF